MTAAPITTTEQTDFRPTRIEVTLVNGRACITTLAHGNLMAARPLQIRGNHVQVALVGINTALLAGDTLEIQVHAGPGVTLEIIEPTGLVAYDAEGVRSTWRAQLAVEENASLIWHGASFVAAHGSNAHRLTRLALADNARGLIRETLTLGRTGETNIQLRNHTHITQSEQPILVENLDINETTGTLPGILAPNRVIATVMAAGWRPQGDETDPQRLDLAAAGALYRGMATQAHDVDDRTNPIFKDWRSQLLAG